MSDHRWTLLMFALWLLGVPALTAAHPSLPQPLPSPDAPLLLETSPRVMAQLEAPHFDHRGLSLASALGAQGGAQGPLDNATLAAGSGWYRYVATDLTEALEGIGRRRPHTLGAEAFRTRLFDARWLRSPYATFELIGVVNRIDRRDLDPDPTRCGELRLLYRLSYHRPDLDEALYSRMPMTLNVIFDALADDEGCAEVAQRWVTPEVVNEGAYVTWLRSTLTLDDPRRYRWSRVEVNVQSLRMPSESKRTLGGHAEYLMRSYARAPGGFRRVSLENTPDVDRLCEDPALREDFLSYIKAHVDEIDRGVHRLPERFLATTATSIGPHGAHREANHPFARALSEGELSGLSLEGTRWVATPAALIARLDDATCTGCHQSNATASFHVLGEDREAKTHPMNALRLGLSVHMEAELPRRHRGMVALLEGVDHDAARPLSFEVPGGAPVGSRCVVDEDLGHWRGISGCVVGARCEALVGDDLPVQTGQCVRETEPQVGDACWRGDMQEGGRRGAHKDKIQRERMDCGDDECLTPKQGAPLGMCYADCAPGEAARHPGERCAWRGGVEFERCAAKGGEWSTCIEASSRRGLRAACDEEAPCREDFICQRAFDEVDGEWAAPADDRGFCVPNYFIFQLRLDGHPSPVDEPS